MITDIAALFEKAVHFHQAGDLAQAEPLYREILKADARNADAHHLLGILANQTGHHEVGIPMIRQAIALNHWVPDYHYNLGAAYMALGYVADAGESFRQTLRLNPEFGPAHNGLGQALAKQAQFGEAADCFRQALRINPNQADTHYDLATSLTQIGQMSEAAECYRQALTLNPEHADAHNNLGILLANEGRPDQAIKYFQEALRLKPKSGEAYNNMACVLKDQGRLDDALTNYQKALYFEPGKAAWQSNRLFTLLYHPGYDSKSLFEEHRRWEQEFAQFPAGTAFNTERTPERRLRIGYISPDFRDHVNGRIVWPLLSHHDHEKFEIALYANMQTVDARTPQFQKCADHWLDVSAWPDEDVADRIRHDGIDILVDLTLHMAGNRLLVFARKPAPVQVTYAGYPGTTGLHAIDYRLTDPYLDPPDLFEDRYAEATVRLPHTFWCYDPRSEEPAVGPLPVLEKGVVTFGCLNNFCKVNDGVLELWGRVLSSVERSRLLLLTDEGSHRQRTLDVLARLGVAPEQVDFCTRKPQAEYLALYHQIDIGLDTLPYSGHTTSLDSFWMGVPVITLVGNTVVGRAGLSQLTNLGLPELAARTAEDFVRLAVELAGDRHRLQDLRMGLRERMKKSPLMDAAGFTKGVEEAYRFMWRKWCSSA